MASIEVISDGDDDNNDDPNGIGLGVGLESGSGFSSSNSRSNLDRDNVNENKSKSKSKSKSKKDKKDHDEEEEDEEEKDSPLTGITANDDDDDGDDGDDEKVPNNVTYLSRDDKSLRKTVLHEGSGPVAAVMSRVFGMYYVLCIFIHSFIHSPIHSFIHSLIHSFNRSLVYLFTHFPIHSVHMEGRLLRDGRVIESHMHEERDFILGRANTATGVEMALSTMKCGERARVEILEGGDKYGYPDSKRPKDVEKVSYSLQLVCLSLYLSVSLSVYSLIHSLYLYL